MAQPTIDWTAWKGAPRESGSSGPSNMADSWSIK
jgi:hypothetical protein